MGEKLMERETMAVLPNFIQPFLTWLTAKPRKEDLEKINKRTPLYHVIATSVLITFGTTLAIAGYSSGFFVPWLLGFVLTTSGIKQMQVMICHNCAHNMVFASRTANFQFGNLLSGFFLLKPFAIYKKEHLLHHDHKTLLTDDDDTLSFLKGTVGLTPNDSVKMMWAKLVWHAFSPITILGSVTKRVASTISSEDRKVSTLTLLFWISLIGIFLAAGQIELFVAVWALPVFAGFHISSTFRLAAEHTWPSVEVLEKRGIAFVSEATTGVFIGQALELPESASALNRSVRITIWLLKMATFHLFVRLFVMVGDTPCHDFHHRRPKSKDWPNYITAREKDLNDGSKPYPVNYEDHWGYLSAVTQNFRNYRDARPYYENIATDLQGVKA